MLTSNTESFTWAVIHQTLYNFFQHLLFFFFFFQNIKPPSPLIKVLVFQTSTFNLNSKELNFTQKWFTSHRNEISFLKEPFFGDYLLFSQGRNIKAETVGPKSSLQLDWTANGNSQLSLTSSFSVFSTFSKTFARRTWSGRS